MTISWHNVMSLDLIADRLINDRRAWVLHCLNESRLAEHPRYSRIKEHLQGFPFPWRMFVKILLEHGWELNGNKLRVVSALYRDAATKGEKYDFWADARRPRCVPSCTSAWPIGMEEEERYFLGLIGVEAMANSPPGEEATGTDDAEPF